MLKKRTENIMRLLLFVVFIALLAIIRAYEEVLFYDPFLEFFKSEFTNRSFPEYNGFRLFISLLFRYFLNSAVSLAMIFVLFKDKEMLKFTSFLYMLFFILLMLAFYSILLFFGEANYLALFYVRRFLIQPLFVILFIPAFYYQARLLKK